MDELEILGIAKTYTKETVIGMGALKGAPCTVQGVVDNGDGTQTLTLRWTDTTGTTHDSTIVLPSAIFEITSPQNGQTLKYNSTSGKFENSNTAFSADLEDLDDVVITTVQDGQVLSYDSATGKWINGSASFVANLSDLDDVTIATLSNGQVLAYNSTSSKWENKTLGTAAAKDSTSTVTQNDTDLVESGGVYTAIDDAIKDLDVSDTAVAGSYVTEVSETDGKISVTREAADAAPTASSKKMVESGGVYTAIDDAIKDLDVSDTAVAGSYVTEVSETDGKISVTREAADAAPTASSKKMVESGGVYTALDDKADKVASATNGNFAGLDANGNLTDSGKKASDFSTAEGLADEAATRSVMGAKNLIPYPYSKGNATVNDVDFTVNSDGTITADGTASDTAIYRLYGFTADTQYMTLKAGTYILSGCPENGGAASYRLFLNRQGDADAYAIDDGEGAEFTLSADTNVGIAIRIAKDYVANSVVVKPMIRLATDADDTYQPYAKTNRELTSDSLQSVSVNGVAQTITNGAADLDVASNLITTAQWTTLSTLYATN